MKVPFIEYIANQGATFKTELDIKTEAGAGMNLIPYTVTSQVRKAYSSSNVAANVVCTMIDAANGAMQLSITAANTATVKAGRYVFDVEAAHNSTGEVVRLVEGMIIFTAQVTR